MNEFAAGDVCTALWWQIMILQRTFSALDARTGVAPASKQQACVGNMTDTPLMAGGDG